MEVFCRMCRITVASVIVMLLAVSFVTSSVNAQSIPEIIENMSPEEQAAFKKKVEEKRQELDKIRIDREITENKTRTPLQQQEEIQAREARALLQQQQQNYSTYEDPILGIRFEYPSWWEISEAKNSIRFDLIGDPKDPMYYNTTKTLDRYTIANVQYFLPSLLKEMNTIDRFMRQKMIEFRFPLDLPYAVGTQNISVNKTSTIGVDDIPAYRVESEDVLSDDIRPKYIHYFTIDNSTGTGYMISLTTFKERLQEDIPLFEKMVESFKFLS